MLNDIILAIRYSKVVRFIELEDGGLLQLTEHSGLTSRRVDLLARMDELKPDGYRLVNTPPRKNRALSRKSNGKFHIRAHKLDRVYRTSYNDFNALDEPGSLAYGGVTA